MIKNMLLSAFLTNIVYLGYNKHFTNSKMFIDLLGVRKSVFLHNLNTTFFNFRKVLNLMLNNWLRFGISWIVAPRNAIIAHYFPLYRKFYYLESILYFWLNKWRYGILTNMKQFSLLSTKLVYPSSLFYMNYTNNFMKLAEGENGGLLQFGIADSNSTRQYYTYLINANEKSSRSYLFFLNIILQLALRFTIRTKKSLLF